MRETIHRFFEKKPLLTLVVFLTACLGACLVPLAGVPISLQIEAVREQGVVMMLVSLLSLACMGTIYMLIGRSPLRPGPPPHEVLIAQGFTQKTKGTSTQLPTYLRTLSGRQVTAYSINKNAGLRLEIACSLRSFVTIWMGKVSAIIVPINWLFGRRRLASDAIPDDVICMARDARWGKSLLENPQIRSLVLSLLADSDLATSRGITINRKSISLALDDFQDGAAITPEKLQQWLDSLSSLADIIEKQASYS